MFKGISIGLVFIVLMTFSLYSQVVQKVLVEHFTNTRCSVCGSRNPGFYNNYRNQQDALHLSIHPSAPYSSCLLYQQNASDNDERTKYYGIYGGTPRLVINGNVISTGANYSSADIFLPYQAKMSPFMINIYQEKFGNESIRSIVSVKTVSEHNYDNLSLFVAVAEDTVFYNAPNGETKHYDVFRKSLSPINGSAIVPAEAIGDSVMLEFSSAMNQIWDSQRIYTIAILQETSSKKAIQAEAVSPDVNYASVESNEGSDEIAIVPNPATDFVELSGLINNQKVELYDSMGRKLVNLLVKGNTEVLNLVDYSAGIYYLRVGGRSYPIIIRK